MSRCPRCDRVGRHLKWCDHWMPRDAKGRRAPPPYQFTRTYRFPSLAAMADYFAQTGALARSRSDAATNRRAARDYLIEAEAWQAAAQIVIQSMLDPSLDVPLANGQSVTPSPL